MTHADLPGLNAVLNATAAALLLGGWVLVRRGRVRAHAACMLLAVVVSAAFLTSYLIYHFGGAGVSRFAHGGWVRTLYLAVLASHTILAAVLPVLVVLTLVRALRGRFAAHRRLARWTLPVWLYVSVTGVLIYLMLYVWFPAPRA
ncbi:MAG: hypothetical protein KatS3mg102_1905 [Planctomycetota bacterium]|nr:MAG: hypothetical protein KatS3mg102_1905 [Planctomycetota bacterium]